jgi:hypothetical protein
MLLEISSSERALAPGGNFLSTEMSSRFAVKFMVAAFYGTSSVRYTCEYNQTTGRAARSCDLT